MSSRTKWTDYLSKPGIQPALFEAPLQPGRRRSGTCRKREPKEVEIQAVILEALRLHPRVLRINRTNTGAGQFMQNGKPGRFVRFGFVGQPDISGVSTDGKVIAIEVKRPSTRRYVSEQQIEYLVAVRMAGGLAGVVTSVEEAFAIVEGRA